MSRHSDVQLSFHSRTRSIFFLFFLPFSPDILVTEALSVLLNRLGLQCCSRKRGSRPLLSDWTAVKTTPCACYLINNILFFSTLIALAPKLLFLKPLSYWHRARAWVQRLTIYEMILIFKNLNNYLLQCQSVLFYHVLTLFSSIIVERNWNSPVSTLRSVWMSITYRVKKKLIFNFFLSFLNK